MAHQPFKDPVIWARVSRFSEFALCDQIILAPSVRDLLAPSVSMGFLIL
jgi:hypothetical protein